MPDGQIFELLRYSLPGEVYSIPHEDSKWRHLPVEMFTAAFTSPSTLHTDVTYYFAKGTYYKIDPITDEVRRDYCIKYIKNTYYVIIISNN